jgi:hypothetical protein
MDAAGPCERGYVGAVVHDKGNAARYQLTAKTLRALEQLTGGRAFVPVLNKADTGVRKLAGAFFFGNSKQRCV